jgi:rhodanese-related sulfurtransferase
VDLPALKKMKHAIALLIFLALVTGAFAADSKFADISHEQLTKVIAAKAVVLLDANGTDSFKSGHIPGAIDYNANKDRLSSLLPADKGALIVAYCYSPDCAAFKLAAGAAADLGYTNIMHYRPGITGWMKSGALVEKGD